MWTINVNKEFHEAFTVADENPSVEHFEAKAVENFTATLVEMFGAKAGQEPVKFCTKSTKNVQRVYVGKPSQLLAFLDGEGVKEALGVLSVDHDKNEFTVSTMDKKKQKGTKKFTLGSDADEDQVLYRRNGFTSFLCCKSKQLFLQDCQLFGLLDVTDENAQFT